MTQTRKEILAQFTRDADAKFNAEYPSGRFTASFTPEKRKWATNGRTHFYLHCIKHRDTSWTSWEGISARQTFTPASDNCEATWGEIKTGKDILPSNNNTRKHFDSLAKCVSYARKHGFSAEIIKAFSDQFLR